MQGWNARRKKKGAKWILKQILSNAETWVHGQQFFPVNQFAADSHTFHFAE